MSRLAIKSRLMRELGMVWPGDEQALILQAIFGTRSETEAAFTAWQQKVDLEQHFAPAIMRLLPLLYLRLHHCGIEHNLLARLKGVYRRSWSDTHLLFHGTAPALAAIQAENIPAMLLKGAPMVLAYYRNFGARPMADLDIAVPFIAVEPACRAMQRAGWQPAAPLTRDDLAFRHAMSFRGPQGHEVDLHWHILYEAACERADKPFWENSVPLNFRGLASAQLAPALNLLHTLAHGMRPNVESPVRWIADAMTILRSGDAMIDWPLFCRTARLLGLTHRVRLALDYLREAHGQDIPAAARESLRRVPRSAAGLLEHAVMARRRRLPNLAPFDRALLVAAEFCYLARQSSTWVAIKRLPAFVRYRLGLPAWPNPVRRVRQRLRRVLG